MMKSVIAIEWNMIRSIKMGLNTCSVNINPSRKELKPHGSIEFPCAGYWDRYSEQTRREFPWHWHEEMEIIYIKSGALTLLLPAKTYHLNAGDCFIINSNILHYISAAPECELQSLVYHPKLVAGEKESAFSVKYILPLINHPSFDGYYLDGETGQEQIGCFARAFEALAGDVPGFEFTVRENVSRICLFLCRQFPETDGNGKTGSGMGNRAGTRAGLNQDNLRMQEMLEFIHHHYQENISLSDVAGAAALGERECLRCFRRNLRMSPMQYALKYRVMRGAELLLREPSRSISETAVSCGFDSPSHFSKMFKRFYSCTPREYRKEKLAYREFPGNTMEG